MKKLSQTVPYSIVIDVRSNICHADSNANNGFFPFFYVYVQPEFFSVCHTKAQYDEEGPRIARHSPVFGAGI